MLLGEQGEGVEERGPAVERDEGELGQGALPRGPQAAQLLLGLAIGWMTMITLEHAHSDFDEDKIFWAVAAPAALKVFEHWFQEKAGVQGVVPSD